MEKSPHDELFRRVEIDQQMRTGVRDWDAKVDEENTGYIRGIIEANGWPTVSTAGEAAAQASWLLVQHADHDPDFQARCLELMKALPAEEILLPNLAYLEDRVRVHQGRPQLFGTQYRLENGIFGPSPIEDEAALDARRAAHGLGPFEEYDTAMREIQANQTTQ